MTERLFYRNTVDAIFNVALRDRLPEEAVVQLAALGIDLRAPLRPTYPQEVVVTALATAARHAFPRDPPVDAYRQLGALSVLGIGMTVTGRALVAMARLIGPRRAIHRLPRNFSVSDNFIQVEVTDVAPASVRVSFSSFPDEPTYYEGVVSAVLQLAGATNIEARVTEVAGESCVIEARWS